MLIVQDEPIPEAEWWAMAPPGVSIHAARVGAPSPWARAPLDDPTALELAPDLERGARQLGMMQLGAITVGHSSSSVVGGKGWDEAVVAGLSQLTGSVPVTTNGLDCLAALRALGIQRPFLFLPPWYSDAVVEAGRRYLSDWGLPPAGQQRFDPGPGYRDLPPPEVHRQGGVSDQDPEPLYQQVRRGCPEAADGVLIAGTGFRAVAVIEALEQDLGRPVVTANQASLWNCLRIAGVRAPVEGYGRLFGVR